MALALSGASSPEDQRLVDRCLSEADRELFAARFLAAKGLAWAGELIERWQRPDTPAPMRPMAETAPPAVPSQVTSDRAASDRPQETVVPLRPKTTEPAERKADDAPKAGPLPGLPGGPPLAERLSPFRVPQRKPNRSAR